MHSYRKLGVSEYVHDVLSLRENPSKLQVILDHLNDGVDMVMMGFVPANCKNLL